MSTSPATAPTTGTTQQRNLPLASVTISSAGSKLPVELIARFQHNLTELLSHPASSVLLRHDQRAILEMFATELAAGTRTGYVDLHPRWGKSRVIALIALAWPEPVLLVTEYRNLVSDLRDEIKNVTARLGLDTKEHCVGTLDQAQRITVAASQGVLAFSKRDSESLDHRSLLLWDESHLSLTPNRITNVIDRMRERAVTLGFTGSDHFNDNKDCGLVWGRCLARSTLDDGVRDERLVLPTPVLAQRLVDLRSIPMQKGELEAGPLQRQLSQHPEELREIHSIVLQHPSEGCLIYSAGRKHGASIALYLQGRGIKAETVFGGDREKNRETLRQFEAGEIQVLIGRKLIALGLDLPRASVLIRSAPLFSQVLAEQLYPRVMTIDLKNPAKSPTVYDFLYPHPKGFGVLFSEILSREIIVRKGPAQNIYTGHRTNNAADPSNPFVSMIEEVLEITERNREQRLVAERFPDGWLTWEVIEAKLKLRSGQASQLLQNLCSAKPRGSLISQEVHLLGASPRIVARLQSVLNHLALPTGWIAAGSLSKQNKFSKSGSQLCRQLARDYAPQETRRGLLEGRIVQGYSPRLAKCFIEHTSFLKQLRKTSELKNIPGTRWIPAELREGLVSALQTHLSNIVESQGTDPIARCAAAIELTDPYRALPGQIQTIRDPKQGTEWVPISMSALSSTVRRELKRGYLSISDIGRRADDSEMMVRISALPDIRNRLLRPNQAQITIHKLESLEASWSAEWVTPLELSLGMGVGEFQARLLDWLGINLPEKPFSKELASYHLNLDEYPGHQRPFFTECCLRAVANSPLAELCWSTPPGERTPRLMFNRQRCEQHREQLPEELRMSGEYLPNEEALQSLLSWRGTFCPRYPHLSKSMLAIAISSEGPVTLCETKGQPRRFRIEAAKGSPFNNAIVETNSITLATPTVVVIGIGDTQLPELVEGIRTTAQARSATFLGSLASTRSFLTPGAVFQRYESRLMATICDQRQALESKENHQKMRTLLNYPATVSIMALLRELAPHSTHSASKAISSFPKQLRPLQVAFGLPFDRESGNYDVLLPISGSNWLRTPIEPSANEALVLAAARSKQLAPNAVALCETRDGLHLGVRLTGVGVQSLPLEERTGRIATLLPTPSMIQSLAEFYGAPEMPLPSGIPTQAGQRLSLGEFEAQLVTHLAGVPIAERTLGQDAVLHPLFHAEGIRAGDLPYLRGLPAAFHRPSGVHARILRRNAIRLLAQIRGGITLDTSRRYLGDTHPRVCVTSSILRRAAPFNIHTDSLFTTSRQSLILAGLKENLPPSLLSLCPALVTIDSRFEGWLRHNRSEAGALLDTAVLVALLSGSEARIGAVDSRLRISVGDSPIIIEIDPSSEAAQIRDGLITIPLDWKGPKESQQLALHFARTPYALRIES